MSDQQDPLALAQLLLGVLDEGRRTSTYKLALLLALMDASVLGTDSAGRPASQLPTRSIAERVVHVYWPMVQPYPRTGQILRQSSQPRAVTVDAVTGLRSQTRADSPAKARLVAPSAFDRCVSTVELNLVHMPLGRLQRPAGAVTAGYPRFLYDDTAFGEHVTARRLLAEPMSVVLLPGVAEALLSLAGLVRPLVELHLTREVARFNRQAFSQEDRLREFLFGASRVDLSHLVAGLTDVQQGRCFYCRASLRRGQVDVDHFLPWSRMPNDALANLVLADRTCNGAKSNHLAAFTHLDAYAHREAGALGDLAADQSWPLGVDESRRAITSLYAHLPAGSSLWVAPGVFEILDPERRTDALAALRA